MGLIGVASVGETTPPADAKLLDSIRDVALKIHATGGLTGPSIAAYLMLPLKPFDGYRPIDIIAAGQPEAAVDAGLCFIEPDRGFDESLRPGIEQAIKILDETWA